MSYILEAIRRSDEERRKRLVPRVSTIHTASSPRSSLGSRPAVIMVFAAGIALAVAATIGARSWLGPESGTEPWTQAAPETLAQAQPEGAAMPLAHGDAPAPAEADRQGGETDNTSSIPAAVLPPPRPLDAPEPTTAKTPPAPSAAKAPREAEKKPDPGRPRTPYSAAGTAPKHQPTVLDPRVLPPPSSSADVAAEAPVALPAPPVPAAEIVSAMALTDLPDPMRRSLPDIAITLHRYADNPAARMIRVNGRVGREGDAVAEDLSIAQITRTGVVFAIGEERFYMDAFQNWQAKNGS